MDLSDYKDILLKAHPGRFEGKCWSTGLGIVDFILSGSAHNGGFPEGKVAEIFGPEGCGKTTLCIGVARSVLLQSKPVLYIDLEHGFNFKYAIALGIDEKYFESQLLVAQPDYAERAFDLARDFTQEVKDGGLIVLDSVAGVMDKSSYEAEMGQFQPGRQSLAVTMMLKRLVPILAQQKVSMLIINQYRSKIGLFSPRTTTGGYALKYYAAIRLEMSPIKAIQSKSPDDLIKVKLEGIRVQFMTTKNKICCPYRTMSLPLYYGKGFNELEFILELMLVDKLVVRSGSFFKYKDQSFQGVVNVIKEIDTLEVRNWYYNKIEQVVI